MATLLDLLSSRLEKLRRNGDGTYQARCPCCAARGGDSKGDHLRIWPASGAFNCVVGSDQDGGAHNRAIRAYLYEGASPEALAALEVSYIDPDPKITADKVYPESMLSQMLPDHRYWVGRGISEAVLRRFEGGMHPPDVRSKMSGRYLFPIRDHLTGKIVGWTGRLTSDASFGPKHKHLCKVKRVVYPLWHTREAILRARKVVFVEGVGDQLACATVGIDYVIDLLGLHLNSRALGFLISANLDEYVVSTNSDEGKQNPATGELMFPGQEAAEKLCAKLRPFLGEGRVRQRLPRTRKDWCKTLEDKTGELEVFKAELEGGVTV